MDPQKRETIEQMMRRDVASGNIGVKIKMPGENNSDELNDIVNYAPTSEYTTYETGRRDDAGNPIMSSDVMDLMMTKSYEPQKESDWSVSNIADSVYTMLRDRFHDGSVEPVDFDNPYYTKDMTAPPEPITGKDLIKGVMPDSFQASKLYADYFYGEDEKRDQIKKAHDLTGIRVETIANDPDVWEKVMKIVQRAEKLKKVPDMLDANGDLNMRLVYEKMPYLKEIVEKHGTNEAVMMLQNAEGLRTVDDAYSNEYTRFWGSVQTGLKRGGYNILKQFTHAKAMIGRRKLTESENEYVAYLEKQKEELPDYSYGGVGQAVGSMIGSAAENIPMIASSQGAGSVAGGATFALTKSPTVAQWAYRIVSTAVMGLEIAGSQYEENLNKLDAKGRAMYTPTQAAALSATQGLAEGVIEQLALQKIARTIFGHGEAKSLRDLYAGAGAKDLALAAEGATANEAARTLIKERILGAAKAGAITFNTELQEEFAQQVSDMVIENMAQMAIKGDDAEISSVRQILQKSTAAAIEAAPSIMGFGLIGFGGHVGAHTRPMLNARSHMENLIKDRLYRSVNENQHLMNTVEAVGDNLKNVQELQGKAPDLVNEMLDSQNRRYGIETTAVDIVSLNQEEGGAELVQEIAAANNISAEELQACADGTGMLPVKTSTLQQMTTNLDEGKRKALFQNITKSSDLFTDKQAQHEAKIVKEVLSAFQSKTEEEVGDSVDRYVESAFAEHEHRALARDILLADVNHPAAEIKRRMNRLDADLTELRAVQNDGSAEAAEYLAQIQPEIEKINAQKDALEAVAGEIKGLQPGDVVATAELSPEARSVYHELAGQLGGAKSKKARTAARASALLAARYADRMAAIYSEVNGEPYTAADYMRDHLRVDAYAYSLEEGLAQAARAGLNLDEQVQVVDIDALTNDLKGKTDQDILDYISKASLLPEVPTADFQALVGLPKDSDSYGQRHLLRGNANRSSDNRIARNITLSNFGDIAKNAVVVEVVPNTKKAPLTGLKGKKRQIQKRKNQISNYYRLMVPVQMNGHIKTLVIVAEEHDGVVSTGSVPVTAYEIYYAKKPPLAAAPRPKTGVSAAEEEAPLTISIRDMLTGVKDADGNVYAQSAWHGSPHDFDAFDLGGIGTGEGAQTHGYGLYFAQDRKVSEWYKDVLGEVQQNIIYAGSKTYSVNPHGYRIEKNSGETLQDGSSMEVALSAFEDSDANVESAIKETQDYLERMGRIQDSDAREKNRNIIRDALRILREEAPTWKLEKKKSSLFRVEIPDDDVLLDEQKPFDEQPKLVQEKLEKLLENEDMYGLLSDIGKKDSRFDDLSADYDDLLSLEDALSRRDDISEWQQKEAKEQRRAFEKKLADLLDGVTLAQVYLRTFKSGREIYEALSARLGGDKAASLALNEVGIKGITYEGIRDGRCYVIFDDQAIQIIEKYNQEHTHGAKGNITATLGGTQRLISLMESADQSTFMHEMAHNFLFDMEHLAEIAPESRYAKDLATIQNWASWTKGAADEYVGTASAAEFRNREEKILAAEKKGDAAEAERLKREWMQERFARGFEEYLRSGEAPAQGLRSVFRRFKAWLTRIYKDVTGAGVRASAEVEAVMARMIATDEEIEAAAVVKRAQRLQKIDPELMTADSAETMIQWETEAKARAKETLLKELIHEMQGRDVDAHMKDYETQLKAEMRENPVWQAEAVAETFGVGQVIASGYYPTVEAYEKALKDAGGGFDAAYNRQMREERERYKTEMPNAEAIAQRAEELLASEEYTARQTALEGDLLNEYIKAYDNAPQRLKDAMIGVARALERDEDAPLEKAVTALKYAFRWQEKQAKEIDDLRALLSSAKESGEEDRAKMREKFGEAFNRLKLSAAQNLEAVRSLRDSAAGRVAAMRAYAQQHLEDAPIHESTNTRHWMRQVQSAAKEAERHLTNMLRKNNGIEKEETGDKDLAAARAAKTRQLAMEAMTHESVKLKRELDRLVKYFARREKNLANDKTGKIDGNHRYFAYHLMYVFGLRRSDGVPLAGEGARSWSQLIEELKSDKSDLDGVDIPEWLSSAATSRDPQRKYTQLSMQELRDLRMLIEFLYVTGRNKNTLLTSGEDVDEVAARIYQNYEEHLGAQDGGKEARAYMVQLLKPETMLKVIGGKSGAIVDYLYNTLFDAQEKKTEALEKNAKRLEAIIGQYYTQKDRRKAWSKKLGINLTDGTELTKENVLSMALNWGNEGNRSRLIAGLSTKTPYTENDVEEIFAKTMTKKDWAFVQEIWDYLNEHGDAVNEVVEKSTGTPMKRVAPDEFTIEASTGELLTIRGGYYPIRYDPKRSERAADQELATVAESVGGAMAFGSGMGSTKNRANGAPLGRPLDLSLDVMYRHIDQQIHIATMRLACRDVYKLMNHSAVKEPILQSLGKDAYDSLKRWVESVWQEPMNNNLYIETKAEEWRANTVTAIMAFRVSTALLNASNIMPMADRLGTVNAIQAMLQYLRHPQRIRQFVLNDSAFMRNRAHNMDRDLNTKGKDIFGGKNSVRKFLVKYGTWLMEETDMLCSVPTYYWTYQQRYNKEVLDGTDEVIARERAHREAHEAVRSIFGSADAIDRSAVQRSQSGLVKAFTPFFSFFNAQMNAVWEKYYAGRYDKHKTNFVERYSAFVRSYLFRFVAMAAIETVIRQSLEAVSAGSGDKKDKDEWYRKFLKQWAANSIGSVASGFPVINMAGEIAQGMITGKLQQGRNSGVVFAAVGRLTDPIQMAHSLQSDKSKIDAIDFGRALTKGVAGTIYAVPDTLTDGFWNTARFMTDNYRLNNPDDLREFIAKTILDKKLKQK